jgi:large subunit ribosomal protein L29
MKQSDITQLSTSDLREKVKEVKGVLAKLRLNHAVSPVESPASITANRKAVARLSTELRKRELAEAKK